MDERPLNRQLSLGWAVSLFWPLACTPLLLVPTLLRQLDASLLIVPAAIIALLAVLVFIDILLRIFTARAAGDEPMYPCPTCGSDVEHTPHRCPRCGARLIWGHAPGPQDVRSFRGQSIEH